MMMGGDYVDKLKDLPKAELVEIYNNLNNWKRDRRLGEKPKYFDEMPNRDKESRFSKYHALKPYFRELKKLTTEKERLKYHHLNNLNRSWLQFQWYWIKKWCRMKILGQSL